MTKYRIYIDETGNPDLASSDNQNHRFLSLTGVIIELTYVDSVLFAEMETMKRTFFGSHPDEPIIFHRKEMVNKKPPFQSLKDPATEAAFNSLLLSKLSDWEYSLITVLIDKKEHNETYGAWKYDSYHYCMAVLLERYLAFLEEKNAVGDVMAESRGGKEDMRLKKSFSRLYQTGTDYIEAVRFQKTFTSKELKVKLKSNNISGLQLADMLAHPSRRHAMLHYALMEKDKEIFGDEIIEVIQSKYYRRKDRLLGYGLKKLP